MNIIDNHGENMLRNASTNRHNISSVKPGTQSRPTFDQKQFQSLFIPLIYKDIADNTVIEVPDRNSVLFEKIGKKATIHKAGSGSLIVNGPIGEGSTIIAEKSSITINGFIGKGCTIKKFGSGVISINGTVGEDVIFKLDMCKLVFKERPPQSVIQKIRANSGCEIIYPSENLLKSTFNYLVNAAYQYFSPPPPIPPRKVEIKKPPEDDLEGPPGGLKWKKY